MSFKIAVSSSDGKVVNRHFGRTEKFLIFEIDGDNIIFLETRENRPSCNNMDHSEEGLLYSINLVKDCRVVLSVKIGTVAKIHFSKYGVDVLEYGGFIDEALKKISKFYKN